jgi:hypothetical protein
MLISPLLALTCCTLLLGLAAGELATLIRVASSSWPALKRAWTWGPSGKPLTCGTCLGFHCAALIGVTFPAVGHVLGDTRMGWLALVTIPPAAAIAAIVQKWVIVEELVLPDALRSDATQTPDKKDPSGP